MQAHSEAPASIANVGATGSRWRLRRLNRLERRLAIQVGLVLLLVLSAVGAPLLTSQNPQKQQIIARMKPPGTTLNASTMPSTASGDCTAVTALAVDSW